MFEGLEFNLRILLIFQQYFIGQEQHIGTKSLPREITLENAVLKPVETGLVRMQVSFQKL